VEQWNQSPTISVKFVIIRSSTTRLICPPTKTVVGMGASPATPVRSSAWTLYQWRENEPLGVHGSLVHCSEPWNGHRCLQQVAEREVERRTKQKIKGGIQMEFDDLDDEYLEEYPVDDLYDEDEDFDLEDELEDSFYDGDLETEFNTGR